MAKGQQIIRADCENVCGADAENFGGAAAQFDVGDKEWHQIALYKWLT